MTRDEKIQAIEDMNIDVELYCPDDYFLHCNCPSWQKGYTTGKECGDCWIKALEG